MIIMWTWPHSALTCAEPQGLLATSARAQASESSSAMCAYLTMCEVGGLKCGGTWIEVCCHRILHGCRPPHTSCKTPQTRKETMGARYAVIGADRRDASANTPVLLPPFAVERCITLLLPHVTDVLIESCTLGQSVVVFSLIVSGSHGS